MVIKSWVLSHPDSNRGPGQLFKQIRYRVIAPMGMSLVEDPTPDDYNTKYILYPYMGNIKRFYLNGTGNDKLLPYRASGYRWIKNNFSDT
jgi:hypothetical protein